MPGCGIWNCSTTSDPTCTAIAGASPATSGTPRTWFRTRSSRAFARLGLLLAPCRQPARLPAQDRVEPVDQPQAPRTGRARRPRRRRSGSATRRVAGTQQRVARRRRGAARTIGAAGARRRAAEGDVRVHAGRDRRAARHERGRRQGGAAPRSRAPAQSRRRDSAAALRFHARWSTASSSTTTGATCPRCSR